MKKAYINVNIKYYSYKHDTKQKGVICVKKDNGQVTAWNNLNNSTQFF